MEFQSAYKDEHFELNYPDGIENNFWNFARNRIIWRHIKNLKQEVGKVLDIGCGRGIVTNFLYEKGIDILGVELGITTPLQGAKVPILYGQDAFKLPEDLRYQINTVLLLDVLEHIKEAVEFLIKIYNFFPNLKWMFITVPARQELWSNYDEYFGHIKRYTPELLKKELKKAKFQIVKCSYFFHLLYIVIYLNNFFLRQRNIKHLPPKSFLSILFHKILGSYFYFEHQVMCPYIIGSSLFCLAKPLRRII